MNLPPLSICCKGVIAVPRNRAKVFLTTVAGTVLIFVFFLLSRWLAPMAAECHSLNPYYFLNWGAPAVFHEDIDRDSALLKLEPWRLLGLQLPAVASIKPTDWKEVTTPPTPDPGAPAVQPQLPITAAVVGIYHSHASEAFVPSTGKARTTDFSQTVVRLGNEIADILSGRGITVVHSEEYHDREYNQSYVMSRLTAQDMVSSYPELFLLIDLHRDGVGATSAQGREVTTCTIQGKEAGKIAFVISTAHGDWQKNNRIANDLHNMLENKYPGLSRGIISKAKSTFNQDLHQGAILVEVGGHWNTLTEAVYGAQLLADVLADYLTGGY
jgi:stage II sporulation protein P